MKRNIKLTDTQSSFLKYFNKNIYDKNRIIIYEHNGHIGLDFVLNSQLPKSVILRYYQLKNKKGKNIAFRILYLVSTLLSQIIKLFTKVDPEISFSTILNNAENMYLGINKKNEELKYLKIKKHSHNYKKIKFIVIVEDDDIKSSADILEIRLLYNMIYEKKINNTALLISKKNLDKINCHCQYSEKYENIPIFELTKDDIQIISKIYNMSYNENIINSIDLIKKFGITFYIDNHKYFELLENTENNMNEIYDKIDWMIKIILTDNKLNDLDISQLYQLLEFVSFFNYEFSKLEVLNFKNNALKANNLDVAYDLKLICRVSNKFDIPVYFYKIQEIKNYFFNKYHFDLYPIPKSIYEYFISNHPFYYTTLLELTSIDDTIINSKQLSSLIIIAYYFNNESKNYLSNENIKKYIKTNTLEYEVTSVYEYFKNNVENSKLDFDSILNKTKNQSVDEISSCAIYCMLLQILKENFNKYKDIKFDSILFELKSIIINIEEITDYNKYWKNYFKCQYVAFSLEDEKTEMRTSRRFMSEISIAKKDTDLKKYIDDNQLRNFDRIELLSFSIGLENAMNNLKSLFETSEESTTVKELARINYSSALIESCNFKEAEKVLLKTNPSLLSSINIDTYCSYYNNFYLVKYKLDIFSNIQYINNVQQLLEYKISFSEKLLILNNLYTVMILTPKYEKEGEQGLIYISNKGNAYSKFFSMHNLLSFYCKNQNLEKFKNIYNNITIPKLLSSNTYFFKTKFKNMYDTLINKKDLNHDCEYIDIPLMYYDKYLFCSTERWFE